MGKRLLMLGGADIQVPAIQYARELGHYVISCDYLPNNPGHQFSHEYHDVSTTDKKGVYQLARNLDIDGILAYASDPAAPTAAYVGNKLGLPSNPYESVNILCNKPLFRNFLIENEFLSPKAQGCRTKEEAIQFYESLCSPAVIKPVDSSGGKGVFKIVERNDLERYFSIAMKYSREKEVILEEFIYKKKYQLGCDAFVVDGQIVFALFGDTHFDPLLPTMAPCSVSVPSIHSEGVIQQATKELQRAIDLLGIKHGALRPDFLVDENDQVYILEIGPRNGGNLIPQLTKYATGTDILLYTIKSALGEDCSDLKAPQKIRFYSHYVIHAYKNGSISVINKNSSIIPNIVEEHLNVKIGDEIREFRSSLDRAGVMLLKYKSFEEMHTKIYEMHKHYIIEVE